MTCRCRRAGQMTGPPCNNVSAAELACRLLVQVWCNSALTFPFCSTDCISHQASDPWLGCRRPVASQRRNLVRSKPSSTSAGQGLISSLQLPRFSTTGHHPWTTACPPHLHFITFLAALTLLSSELRDCPTTRTLSYFSSAVRSTESTQHNTSSQPHHCFLVPAARLTGASPTSLNIATLRSRSFPRPLSLRFPSPDPSHQSQYQTFILGCGTPENVDNSNSQPPARGLLWNGHN